MYWVVLGVRYKASGFRKGKAIISIKGWIPTPSRQIEPAAGPDSAGGWAGAGKGGGSALTLPNESARCLKKKKEQFSRNKLVTGAKTSRIWRNMKEPPEKHCSHLHFPLLSVAELFSLPRRSVCLCKLKPSQLQKVRKHSAGNPQPEKKNNEEHLGPRIQIWQVRKAMKGPSTILKSPQIIRPKQRGALLCLVKDHERHDAF